jgi:hypothetical protein
MAELLRRVRGPFIALCAAVSACAPGCYSVGNGTSPPPNIFYFPVGLAVSQNGNVLYAINSDFDLQWNGGTLQSYDLTLIRNHTLLAIANPSDPALPLVMPAVAPGACPNNPPLYKTDDSGRQPLGWTCAPPVDSTHYVRDSAIVGAFATDLQLSKTMTRLFAPVRGNASLSWADVALDDGAPPSPSDTAATYAPFALDCGTRSNDRCDSTHQAGNNPNEPGNTRQLVMPGEPFGMAQSEDGSVVVITHQTDTKTSLLTTGFGTAPPQPNQPSEPPALQFVLDGLPVGGNGIYAVPHDPDAFPNCGPDLLPGTCAPRPAFLQTSRNVAQLNLLRYYSDIGGEQPSSLHRPFIANEAAFSLSAVAGGTDSRGIVIDKTPRIACKFNAATPDQITDCARRPARVFFANRTPASMVLGEIGEPSAAGDGTYDADRLVVFGDVPLSFGPSRLYLAPIVDQDGNYALRVFIVNFDSATVVVYDPDANQIENIIHVGVGPFAMAFDPFSIDDVALKKHVDPDPRGPAGALLKYRFAYVASFTNSFVQAIDLDNSRADKSTFERVVFTLGAPTSPKGTH